MTIEVWLAFVLACVILTLIPGPSVMLVIGQALTKGSKAAFLCIAGDLFAGVVLMVLSLLGVGAILATSVTLFVIMKWAGVFYMAYLGYCQIRDARRGNIVEIKEQETSGFVFANLKAGFLSAILNPKAIMFYMAFLTQFMNPEGDVLLQFSILITTSSVVIGAVLSIYVLLASKAKRTFQSPKAQKYFGYTGGSCLIGGSVIMAATR